MQCLCITSNLFSEWLPKLKGKRGDNDAGLCLGNHNQPISILWQKVEKAVQYQFCTVEACSFVITTPTLSIIVA